MTDMFKKVATVVAVGGALAAGSVAAAQPASAQSDQRCVTHTVGGGSGRLCKTWVDKGGGHYWGYVWARVWDTAADSHGIAAQVSIDGKVRTVVKTTKGPGDSPWSSADFSDAKRALMRLCQHKHGKVSNCTQWW